MDNNKKEISNRSRKIKYQIRKLTKEDLNPAQGYLKTLSNLAEVGELDRKEAEKILEKIYSQGSQILIAITNEGQIIGSVTLMLEQKFLRGGKLAGHIEDVVTRKGYEGIGVASALMKKAIQIAKEGGCYKLILDCNKKLISFYKKFDFQENEVCMKIYFKD